MSLEVEATYMNGSLVLDAPLPLGEHERVRVTVEAKEPSRPKMSIEEARAIVAKSSGIIPWFGSLADLQYLAEDAEYDFPVKE